KDVIKVSESAELADKFVFNPDIPMPVEHQKYLFKKCEERNLNFKKALAVIKHESNFNQNAIGSSNDYGYFQINEMNHEVLADKLSTTDSPLDPYVNIEWGTFILADLYEVWSEKGLVDSELDHSVWS